MDVHRQTVVNNNRIRQSLGLPYNGEPYRGVGIVVCILSGGDGLAGVLFLIGVAGNIGRIGFLGVGNCPSAGSIGINNHHVLCAVVVQGITAGQDVVIICHDFQRFDLLALGYIQEHLGVQRGVHDGNAVGEGNFLAVHVNRLAACIYQIECVADVCCLPCQNRRCSILLAGITQVVVIVQNRTLVGGVGTSRLTAHGAVQVDIVAQGQLIGDNVADGPVEGFGIQVILSSTVVIGIDLDSAGLIGVIPEGGSIDHTIQQDIAACVNGRTVGTNGSLVGVCLRTGIVEGNGLQRGVDVFAVSVGLAVTDLIDGALALLILRTGPDGIGSDFHLGSFGQLNHSAVACSGNGFSKLDLVILTHGIHKAGVVGCVGNVTADG